MGFPTSLTGEARHFVKIGDLDSLECFARQSGDVVNVSSAFQDVFEALDRRTKLGDEIVLEWGRRYIAWARSVPDRDGLPFFGTTDWARRLFELAITAARRDLALEVVEAMLASYAPLEKERRWWQKQRYQLTASPHA